MIGIGDAASGKTASHLGSFLTILEIGATLLQRKKREYSKKSVVLYTSQQQYHKDPGSVMCHPLSAFLVAVVPTILELSSAPGEKQAARH